MPLTIIIKGKEISINDCDRTPCEVWSRVM